MIASRVLADISQDIRFALRQFRKNKSFTVMALLTLAIGIGATTAVFSLVDAVLLKPLPFPESGRLMSVTPLERINRDGGAAVIKSNASYLNFFDWQRQNKSFESMFGYHVERFILPSSGNSQAQQVDGTVVTANFTGTLGVSPALGRGFRKDEELAGNHSVLISDTMWQREFGRAADVLGRTVKLNEDDFTVIGVMPKGFGFPVEDPDVMFWVTSAIDAVGENNMASQRGWNDLDVAGRLKPGVTQQQAKAEMDTIQQALAVQYPDNNKNSTAVDLVPQLESISGNMRGPLGILFGAVCFLLLIACANVAGLLLTRTNQRMGELAIRAALGASRMQIVRQLLIESVTLSACGGAIGVALAAGLLQQAPALLPANLPRAGEIAINGGVLAFAICASLVTGLLFGVLPAWRTSKLDPTMAMRESGRGTAGGRKQNRLHAGLVIAETAIGLVLLVGAGLLIRSFDRILRSNPGFNPQHVLTFRIAMPDKRYSDQQITRFYNELLPKLEALPGVKVATAGFPLPLAGGNMSISFNLAEHPVASEDEPSGRASVIEPNYFAALQIPLRKGRFFKVEDNTDTAPAVAIVNDAFAKKYFPGEEAVGKHMRSGLGNGKTPPLREIVGVVGNATRLKLTEEATPEYFIPLAQAPIAAPPVAMRVAGDPMSYAKQVSAVVAGMDSSLPVYRVWSYDEYLHRSTAQERFQTLLLTAFAGIALLLAAVGLYAVLSYMVSQRMMELGLRMALGAQRGDVLQLILQRGLWLAAAGLGIGLVVAGLMTRFLAGMLYGVQPLDVATFAGMTLVLLEVSAVASLVPAWRASQLNPMETLRDQ